MRVVNKLTVLRVIVFKCLEALIADQDCVTMLIANGNPSVSICYLPKCLEAQNCREYMYF